MINERRTHPRAPGVLDGTWSGSFQPCRISSLSVAGCYIEALLPPKPGVPIRVTIELPQQGPVSVHANVVDMEPGIGFAVRFVDVTSETHERLAWAVDYLIVTDASTSPRGQPRALAC